MFENTIASKPPAPTFEEALFAHTLHPRTGAIIPVLVYLRLPLALFSMRLSSRRRYQELNLRIVGELLPLSDAALETPDDWPLHDLHVILGQAGLMNGLQPCPDLQTALALSSDDDGAALLDLAVRILRQRTGTHGRAYDLRRAYLSGLANTSGFDATAFPNEHVAEACSAYGYGLVAHHAIKRSS